MESMKRVDFENFLQLSKKLTLLFPIHSVHVVVKNEEMESVLSVIIISKKGSRLGYLEH